MGLAVVLALAALAGIGVAAVHVLPWAMIPDAIEWDELQTGQRHEGMFYSLVLLLRKVASSMALPLMLLALDGAAMSPTPPCSRPAAVRAIQIMTGPVPALFLGVGIAFAVFYPLGRARHAEIRAEIAARAEAARLQALAEVGGEG